MRVMIENAFVSGEEVGVVLLWSGIKMGALKLLKFLLAWFLFQNHMPSFEKFQLLLAKR